VLEEVIMGLIDVLNGMQNGPRGPKQPGSGGMSPLTMALLGLLAYKAIKKFNAPQAGGAPAGNAQIPSNPGNPGLPGGLGGVLGGDLGNLLKGGLGGLLAGGAAGGLLSGGLGDLLKQFEQTGHGDEAHSWVSTGQNKPIAPNDLQQALGYDTVNTLSEHTGMSRDDLLSELSRQLPAMVDHMTPQGRVPTADEMSRMV
jgi:uncharacterized protein YidB (DUF937 family)